MGALRLGQGASERVDVSLDHPGRANLEDRSAWPTKWSTIGDIVKKPYPGAVKVEYYVKQGTRPEVIILTVP